MKVLLVGYGRMGKEIEQIIETSSSYEKWLVHAKITQSNPLNAQHLEHSDIVIDFSLPRAVEDHLKLYAQAKSKVVMGVTAWQNEQNKDFLQRACDQGMSLLWGNNFSLGAHVLLRASNYSSKLIDALEEYDVSLCESHHRHKQDVPSGTAVTLLDNIVTTVKRKTSWASQTSPQTPEILHYQALRCGEEIGKHEVIFDSFADTVSLTHHARNRSGFALGALKAAEWLSRQTNGLYTIEQMLDEIWSEKNV